jgi:hypothetical protein
MHRITNPNLEILEAAVELLDELADRLVFLGGCATGLLLTDVAAPPIHATQDVDVITEVDILYSQNPLNVKCFQLLHSLIVCNNSCHQQVNTEHGYNSTTKGSKRDMLFMQEN